MLTFRLVRSVVVVASTVAFLLPLAAASAGVAAIKPTNTIKAGNGPEAIAVDTQNATAWIADNAGDSVTEIAHDKVRATIPLGAVSPIDIAVDSRTGTVWVADGSSGSVTEISAKTGHVVRTVTLSQTDAVANAIAVDPVHGEVFVTEINLGDLVEFRESDPSAQHVANGGNTPLAVAADSSARTAWVTDEVGTVTEISYRRAHPTVLHTLHISGGTGAIAADATAGLIFVAEYTGNAVAIISAASRKVRTVKVGHSPGSLAVDPLHGDVWVANDGSSSISQIRESTRKVLATYPLGFSPSRVAVQPAAGVYAVDFTANAVRFLAARLRLSAPGSATFRTGRHGSLLITAAGFPAASVSLSGKLPAGLHWSASGAGGRVAGTPKRGTDGTYHVTLRASTTWGQRASRSLTIRVR